MKVLFLTLLAILSNSCNNQETNEDISKDQSSTVQIDAPQIAQYVVGMLEDSKGNLWFGTLEKGVAKYDGLQLTYLTKEEGLPSNRITSIVEDTSGNLWFGTGSGISRFDGETFTNYSEKNGLCSDMVSNLLIDKSGSLWIGTWGGVCQFDGEQFENFSIPHPEITTKINPDTKDWITTISEDSKGNIWFGRDGYGACKYDGKTIVHVTTKEGLNSNNVQSIIEDKEGNIWVGTRVAEKDNADPDKRYGKGGLNKIENGRIVHFPEIRGLSENDIYAIYKDSSEDLWISTTNDGVYSYKNKEFINYNIPNATMSFMEDKTGNIWIGCAGGLYRVNTDGSVINITTNGPW